MFIKKRYKLLDYFKEYLDNYCYLDTIDIKYKDTIYYEKPEDREKQDIHKQFVYEYLLQESTKEDNIFKYLDIKTFGCHIMTMN